MAVTQRLRCRVEHVVDHGDRVYTILLKPERAVPRFRAGQFLHLALDPYDPSRFWPDSRPFSIASSPALRDALRISYSVQGRFTTRMERELGEGRDVWVKMPYGDFVVNRAADVALFAGGTGITAFTAFLESLTTSSDGERSGPRSAVFLAYGARNSRLLIYRDMVDRWARDGRSIDVSYFVEQPSAHGESPAEAGHPTVGRISVAALWPRLRRPLDTTFYLAGPPAMLQTISQDLKANQVSPGAIHIDAWE